MFTDILRVLLCQIFPLYLRSLARFFPDYTEFRDNGNEKASDFSLTGTLIS